MAQAKTLYEAAYPETKQGGAAGKAGGGKAKTATVAGFVRFMAKETGLAPRTIAYDVEIATGIIPEVKEKLAGTPLANATRDLILISKLSEGRQAVVARKVDEGVAAVRKQLKKWRKEPTPSVPEAQVQTVSLALAQPVAVRIGTRTCLATLLSIDGSTVSVQIDSTGPQREAVEPLAETPEEIEAPTENVDSQPVPVAEADAAWATLEQAVGVPLDAENMRNTFTLSAAEHTLVERLKLPPKGAPAVAVFGPHAEVAASLLGKRAGQARKLATAAGLKEIHGEEPAPGTRIILVYGTAGVGVTVVAAGCAEGGRDVPTKVYSVTGSPDRPIAFRVDGRDPVLGNLLMRLAPQADELRSGLHATSVDGCADAAVGEPAAIK